MSRGQTVSIDKVSDAIVRELRNYNSRVQDAVPREVDKVAKEARSQLQKTSPKRTGRYARSWAIKRQWRGSAFYAILYARAPFHSLVHLLEKGHRRVIPARGINSGFVAARPHVARVEDEAKEALIESLERIIREAGQ